jgi:hypothetical protein
LFGSTDRLEQEFQDFDVSNGVGKRPAQVYNPWRRSRKAWHSGWLDSVWRTAGQAVPCPWRPATGRLIGRLWNAVPGSKIGFSPTFRR